MKKFIICLALVLAGVSCNKESTVCGCSPIEYSFFLVVKNQQNADLLDPAIQGSYNKEAVKISYKKDAEIKEVGGTTIKAPFQTSGSSMHYHSIYSNMANLHLASNVKEFYIDFGNGDKDTITFDAYNKEKNDPINLKVNNVLLAKEPTAPQGYPAFYVIVK